jgi:hypothetical protein
MGPNNTHQEVKENAPMTNDAAFDADGSNGDGDDDHDDQSLGNPLPKGFPPEWLHELHNNLQAFLDLGCNYGLFANMTKQRDELLIECLPMEAIQLQIPTRTETQPPATSASASASASTSASASASSYTRLKSDVLQATAQSASIATAAREAPDSDWVSLPFYFKPGEVVDARCDPNPNSSTAPSTSTSTSPLTSKYLYVYV